MILHPRRRVRRQLKKWLDHQPSLAYNTSLMPVDKLPAGSLKKDSLSDREYYLFALRIAGDFGATIAAPIVLLAWLGHWADARWHTQPYLTAAGFVLAAVSSGILIYRKAKTYGAHYQQMGTDLSAKKDSTLSQ